MAMTKAFTKTAVKWTLTILEKICVPVKIVNALTPSLVKIIVFVVVALAYEWNLKPTAFRKIRSSNFHKGPCFLWKFFVRIFLKAVGLRLHS